MAKMTLFTLAYALAVTAAPTATTSLPWKGTSHCATNTHYPIAPETAYASRHAVDFLTCFSNAKSEGSASKYLALYSPENATNYYDSTLGLALGYDRPNLVKNLTAFLDHFREDYCNAQSFPLRILGDTVGGALIYSENTPNLLGAEIRAITSFDFVDGLIRRQCDNWDGRDNPVTEAFGPPPPYPSNLGLAGVKELADPQMQRVSHSLNAALSSGNATAAAALFNYNAIFEDLTLRARVEGVIQIGLYLQRAVHLLPYGVGTKVFHVLGNAIGGGYEWTPTDGVKHGITALELDSNGMIMKLTAVWDGGRLNTSTLQTLTQLVLDPPLSS